MLCSWRKSTKKQYKVFVKKWFSYCRERKISEVQISINIVLDYLTILFENGLGYSSINTARSALSALGLVIDNVLVGAHPLVVRFMKGVYNLRPTKSKNICVWDVSLVLNYLRKLSPVNMLTLQEVTLKLVMLIALTNATRVQTLKFLSVDCMEKLRDEFVFHLDVLLKQSRPGYKNPDVKLRAFPPDRRLCVYTVLKEYIKRTEILRVHTKQLLISYIKPHKAVTCSTISRWIKVVLQKSGIDTRQFSAHSVRSAATSKAKLYNVSLADIMSKAEYHLAFIIKKFVSLKTEVYPRYDGEMFATLLQEEVQSQSRRNRGDRKLRWVTYCHWAYALKDSEIGPDDAQYAWPKVVLNYLRSLAPLDIKGEIKKIVEPQLQRIIFLNPLGETYPQERMFAEKHLQGSSMEGITKAEANWERKHVANTLMMLREHMEGCCPCCGCTTNPEEEPFVMFITIEL
ncbi:unnamed protein product [Mytilus edulis]|uniref:Core-binding (CB) domain-containing protein n=1 Tax=Mytilus edulis TaxID=6550 RepID=A0A8S3VGP4_MYTED|nr:unnamed protein product [Mytilus edulis]